MNDLSVNPCIKSLSPLHMRSRILFIGEAVSLAHVGRPAVLATWASEAGYDAHFACGDAFASVACAAGFAPHKLATISAEKFYSRLNSGGFFYTVDELDAYVRAEMELIEELQPALIVGDFRLTLSISAALCGVPLVALNNAHWSPAAACPFPAPDSGLFRVLPSALRKGLFALLRPLAFRTFAGPLNIVRRRYGLKPLNDFREHYTAGTHCVYMDLPELAELSTLPEGHMFLGPVAWEPRGVESPALGELGSVRPLAYVTLGSSGDIRVLPNVLRALLALQCDIVLSGVNATQFSALQGILPELKGRCLAAPLFNPNEVLMRAAVTICHGGSGTVYQSLAAGVPLLCLPGNPDQSLVSATVLAKGAGLVLEPHYSTLRSLQTTIGALLKDVQFSCAALSLGASIAQHDTRKCWQDFLQRVAPQTASKQRHADRRIAFSLLHGN